MKNAMELEDAEQAYYSQWWRWGYDDQPPLYTWIQILVNSVFGVSKFSFSVLRAIIFFGILMLLYRFSMGILKNWTKASLVIFGLVFVPVFIDFTFRRLSHTALLCLVVVATYLLIQKLIQQKSLGNYTLFGIVVGVGMLTKYNYLLVLMALGLGLLLDNQLRQIVWNKKIFISIIIGLCLFLPHLYWLVEHHAYLSELQNSIAIKTESGVEKGIPGVSSVVSLALTLLKLIAPLLVLVVVLVLSKRVQLKFSSSSSWLIKLLYAQLLVLTFVFLGMNIEKVEARWLLPLLIPFLVLLPGVFVIKHSDKWVDYGYLLFVLIIMAQTLRTPIERILGIPSSVHFGFKPVSQKLHSIGPEKQWVLPNVTFAGNIRLLNPGKEIFSSDDYTLPSHKILENPKILVTIGKDNLYSVKLKDSISSFGMEKEKLIFYELN